MEAEVYQLKSEQANNLSPMNEMDANAVRTQVAKATRDFKNSWKNLAQALNIVWKDKLYRNWGYEKFDQFTEKEVHIRKHTAMKLIRSYAFLEKEEPLYLPGSGTEVESDKIAPSFEAVNTLQRARKSLGDDDYRKVKSDLLEKRKNIGEVKKDLAQMIMRSRKDVDLDKERTRSGRVAIVRFIAELKKVKREIEVFSVLPAAIGLDIDKLINKVEGYISQ